ncbi:MAG: LruC domain-containing protein [Spirochaetaceae bacterium]|nr:LruC domain-containing protein [Spirochaetaceae bacterium]
MQVAGSTVYTASIMKPVMGKYNMRKAVRKAGQFTLALLVLTGLTNCSDSKDPNLTWLLGLADGSSQTTTGEGTSSEIPFSYEITDIQQGTGDFVFETNKSIPVDVLVEDPAGGVAGTRVLIRNNEGDRVLFRAKTDEEGNASGVITVNQDEKTAVIEVVYNGQPIRVELDITEVKQSSITILVGIRADSEVIQDADGDGIPDSEDHYPNDPERATVVRVPAEGFYRVAYEDLYPKRGDADFNDYVVEVFHEQDLNAAGDLVELRSYYTHIAKGAGYNHTLHLAFPAAISGQATVVRKDAAGAELETVSEALSSGNALQLLGRSDGTLASSNTARNQDYAPGHSAELTFLPDSPVALATLGKAPYDLFIKVLNTGHEIHFAGKYFNEDGSDRYIDSAGFPWALMVPDYWQWPYERANIHDGYPDFDDWYLSAGADFQNWYDTPVSEFVFPAQ